MLAQIKIGFACYYLVLPLSCHQSKIKLTLIYQTRSTLTFVRQTNDEVELSHQLQEHYQGFGKDSARELAAELLQSDNLPATYQHFLKHFENPEPVLITHSNGKTQFAVFPPLNIDGELQHFDSLSALLDAFYANKAEQDRSKELAGQVLKVLKNELKKDRRKVKNCNNNYKMQQLQISTEFVVRSLLPILVKLTPGMKEIELPNFYDDNKPLKIKLAPELSPSRNAQKVLH